MFYFCKALKNKDNVCNKDTKITKMQRWKDTLKNKDNVSLVVNIRSNFTHLHGFKLLVLLP